MKTMTRNDLNKYLCAILTTLEETGGWAPRTMLMLGAGLEFSDYTMVEGIMVRGELAVATSETLTITEKGRAIAAKVNAALKAA